MGHDPSENKPPGLDASDEFGGTRLKRSSHPPAGVPQPLGMTQQGGNVAEKNALFGVVGNVADVGKEGIASHGILMIGKESTAGKGKPTKVMVLVNGSQTRQTVHRERYARHWPVGVSVTEQPTGKSLMLGETLDLPAMTCTILEW